MKNLKIGDPVIVNDPFLLRLAEMFLSRPRNKGWVKEIFEEDDEIMVEFPIGDEDPDEHSQIAPYPFDMVSFDPLGNPRKE